MEPTQNVFPGSDNQSAPELANYARTEGGFYVYQVTLSASQALTDQTVIIDADSDFLILGLAGTQTGNYRVNFKSGNGRYIAQSQIRNANLVGTGQFPVPLPKPLYVPSRGRIGIDITDLSGGSNVIELVFIGIRLYSNSN